MNLKRIYFLLIPIMFASCQTVKIQSPIKTNSWNGDYNTEILFDEPNFNDPKKDSLGFYRLLIDKSREERTTIKLRSQKRVWQGTLHPGRHLFSIERWELDSSSKQYKRAKNLLQPKPDSYYFTVQEERLSKLHFNIDQKGSRFSLNQSYYPEERK